MMRKMAAFVQIAAYWSKNYASPFPRLADRHEIATTPFCFRCGWRSPLPSRPKRPVWSYATGWLERAHLHDHAGGGSGAPDNLVPLCSICHRSMPAFPTDADRGAALTWVAAERHLSCPRWWQQRTNDFWSGDRFEAFPGTGPFLDLYLTASRVQWLFDEAFGYAESGDRDKALEFLEVAGVSEIDAAILIDACAAFAPKDRVAA